VRVTSMEGLKLIVEPVQTPAVTVG
jgi:hypothetical protein